MFWQIWGFPGCAKLLDIETWLSHQCLDCGLRPLKDALCGRVLALYRLPAAARASFIFTFLRSSTRGSRSSYVAEAPGVVYLQQPLEGAPAAQAGVQSLGSTAQETRGWRLETAPVSAARAVAALWLRSRAGWHPLGSGVTSQVPWG